MESVLILDITRRFLERFFIKDINLISMLLKGLLVLVVSTVSAVRSTDKSLIFVTS